ncbi:MAG: EAL domain-containing protein [Actinomycetota bacterium]|nr:EAL domain-containing protein [Actinomycetota bacterium]
MRQSGSGDSRFRAYTLALVALAALALAVAASDGWHVDDPAAFAVLAAFTLTGELLCVPMPRRGSFEDVTLSPAFAFAILVLFGPLPAVAVYAAACLVVEVRERTKPVKAAFNVAQYTLSMSVAAGALALATGGGPVDSVTHELLAVLAAGAAFFVTDNVLTGIGVALLQGGGYLSAIARDATFHAWTTGSLVACGPVAAVVADASPLLVPLLSLPMFAIYVGGRAAVAHSHRLLHDELTELPNRRLFRHELAAEIATAGATGGSVVVVVVNLSDFRSVNEALGHRQGDALLEKVGPRLESMLRDGDLLARLGGDEFGILRSSRSLATPADLAALVGQALAAPFEVAGISLEVHAVAGAASWPGHGNDADELLRNADAALHRAKEERLPHCVYEPELDDRSVDRLVLAGQLGRAIENGELYVRYQPKLAVAAERTDMVEALVRWRHPELGEIQPDGFIPLAERTGLIRALTAEVLRESLRQCARWRLAGLELRVSVNLSPRSLLDGELPARVESALADAGLEAGVLQLEVTETSIVTDAPRAREVLGRLREVGVSIAIDDFGTGYSSLAQLQSLPVDEIKIDRSFVIGMRSDEGNAAIVRSTIDLGRNLGLAVTAEGVEDEATAMQLARLGCDYLQGYHLGPPLTADGCRELLSERLHSHRSVLRPGGGLRFGSAREGDEVATGAGGA